VACREISLNIAVCTLRQAAEEGHLHNPNAMHAMAKASDARLAPLRPLSLQPCAARAHNTAQHSVRRALIAAYTPAG
jgi:hypothetical protein